MVKETHKGCILYVEDDPALSYITRDNLESLGYKVMHYDNGQAALSNFSANNFNLCLLDVMLPKMDGFELAKRIREMNEEIPILFLSAKSGTDDRIEGLALGGDDYLTKPFSIEELRLKIEIFLKRNKIVTPDSEFTDTLIVGKYQLEVSNQLLRIDKEALKLTLRETRLMELFFQNVNNLIPRQEILLKIWGDDSYFNGRSLDVFISRIRKYLKEDENLEVESIRSTGFRLSNHHH